MRTLAEELKRNMEKYRMNLKEVSEQSKLDKRKLQDILKGDTVSRTEITKLRRAFPAMGVVAEAAVSSIPPRSFTEALAEEVKASKLSLDAVGELVDCSRQAVTAWISGRNTPGPENYRKLCDLFPSLKQYPPRGQIVELQPSAPPATVENVVDTTEPESIAEPAEEPMNPVQPAPSTVRLVPSVPATEPRSTRELDRIDLVRFGMQLASICAEIPKDQLKRIQRFLEQAAKANMSASEVAECLNDYYPEATP